MPGFLAPILSALGGAAASFLSGAGATAGGAVANSLLGGSSTRVRREDVDHNQNMADLVNPREIRRQSEFLTGIAPAQAQAYNTYQDQTFNQDTARNIDRIQQMTPVQAQSDLQYMDTVYAGTSPWERLGSSAAPSIQAPSPTQGAPRQATSDVGSQFLPLILAQMNNDTAKQTAAMSNATQLNVAKIQAGQSAENVSMQTAGGLLPTNQAAQAAAQTLLTEASTEQIGVETDRTEQQTKIDAGNFMSSLQPSEVIDLGIIKYSHKPGWRTLLPLLTGSAKPGDRRNEISETIAKLPADQWSGVKRDVLELASLVTKGAQGLSQTTGFLKNVIRNVKK